MSYSGSSNVIPLISMHSCTEKHPKQLGSNAQYLVCASVTVSYSEGVQKPPLKIGLMNCQLVCYKCVEIIDVIGDVGFTVLDRPHFRLLVMQHLQAIHSIMQLALAEKVAELAYSFMRSTLIFKPG